MKQKQKCCDGNFLEIHLAKPFYQWQGGLSVRIHGSLLVLHLSLGGPHCVDKLLPEGHRARGKQKVD
jgi:hypothetical protein